MKAATLEIIDALGEGALAEARGVGPHSMRQIRHRGVFPESWMPAVLRMAEQKDVDLAGICRRHSVDLVSLFQVTTHPVLPRSEAAPHNV